jgi:hypothetical protein
LTPKARKPIERTAAQDNVLTTLPAAMTGRASPAKAAVGDKPVFAYIASLPQPQREIAEHIDALAAKTLPGLQRAVKCGRVPSHKLLNSRRRVRLSEVIAAMERC